MSFDAVVSGRVVAGTDYDLAVTLRGLTVGVSLNGRTALTHTFNGVMVDGRFGLLSRVDATSFGFVKVKTDDPMFLAGDPAGGGGDVPARPMLKTALGSSLLASRPASDCGRPAARPCLSGWLEMPDQQGRRTFGRSSAALTTCSTPGLPDETTGRRLRRSMPDLWTAASPQTILSPMFTRRLSDPTE